MISGLPWPLADSHGNSTNSIDDILNQQDLDAPPDAWRSDLNTRIEQIIDRKRSSVQGREESLAFYTGILIAHYAKDDVESRIDELITGILRSVRAESSERETVFALRGVLQQHDKGISYMTDTYNSAFRDAYHLPVRNPVRCYIPAGQTNHRGLGVSPSQRSSYPCARYGHVLWWSFRFGSAGRHGLLPGNHRIRWALGRSSGRWWRP